MDREILTLLNDLHRVGLRQGPGGDEEIKRALALAGLDRSRPLTIADIGCGTGASTILLAEELDARITAVDSSPEFLEILQSRAAEKGVADKITTLHCSMADLPFSAASLDVIWSEGAIYNIGFENGISKWHRFLKPEGKLVVSEITWLRDKRPSELQKYWEQVYPEIDLASTKIRQLERNGYCPEGYFVLPPRCWLENYYEPVQERFDAFLERNHNAELAKELVASEKEEIAIYHKYRDHYSYGVYIATRSD